MQVNCKHLLQLGPYWFMVIYFCIIIIYLFYNIVFFLWNYAMAYERFFIFIIYQKYKNLQISRKNQIWSFGHNYRFEYRLFIYTYVMDEIDNWNAAPPIQPHSRHNGAQIEGCPQTSRYNSFVMFEDSQRFQGTAEFTSPDVNKRQSLGGMYDVRPIQFFFWTVEWVW